MIGPPLNKELKEHLDSKRKQLEEELRNGSFKVDSMELLNLINSPHPLAKKMDDMEKAKKEKKFLKFVLFKGQIE